MRLCIMYFFNLIKNTNYNIKTEAYLVKTIFYFAVTLMYTFWDENVNFFYEFFQVIKPEDYKVDCFAIKNKFSQEKQLN